MFLRRWMRRLLPERVSLWLRRQWLGRRVGAGKGHFEDDVPLLKDHVQQTDVCWDIGANTGTYTLHLSRLAAKVFAFEPVPHNLGILQDVKRRAGLTNVVINQLASRSRRQRQMTVPLTSTAGTCREEDGELEVEMSTIDALIASGVPEPDFIKVDVEGAETRVIAGARELIARRHPIWLLETFEDEVVDLLRSLGYAAFVRNSDQQLIEIKKRVHERNYWFFPARSLTGGLQNTTTTSTAS